MRQNMVVVYFPINYQLSILILEPLTSARSRHFRSGWMSEFVNVVWYLFRYVKKRKKNEKPPMMPRLPMTIECNLERWAPAISEEQYAY